MALNRAGIVSALVDGGSGGGGLQKLRIAFEGHDSAAWGPIEALFNPAEISRSRSVNWYQRATATQGGSWTWSDTEQQFLAVAPETLSVELFFDTYESRAPVPFGSANPLRSSVATDVRDFTDRVARLAEVDPDLHHPPICRLSWGAHGTIFTGVLTQLDQRFTLFLADGTPVRATVSCAFLEFRTRAQARSRERHSADVVKTRVVRAGDTLQGVAAQEYRDPALWRHIATANGIVDPRALVPGTVLTIPKLVR